MCEAFLVTNNQRLNHQGMSSQQFADLLLELLFPNFAAGREVHPLLGQIITE